MIHRHILGWFGLLVIAIVNGAIRDFIYRSYLGDLLAHQVSTGIGIILFGIFIWYLNKRWPLASSHQAWTVGFIWLGMTISFEFLFFHYVRNIPWEVLVHDYNIFEGRVWILVLVWTTIAPWVMWRWSKK
jgi:hypothetical protein